MKDLFISHSHADKPFVRNLANDCRASNLSVWVDEAELLIGDSLIHKIQEAIDKTRYFLVVVSANSVNSNWVQRELEQAMELEITSRTVKVLPVVLGQVKDLPGFLRGKLFADFSNCPGDNSQYNDSVRQLVRSIKVRSQANGEKTDVADSSNTTREQETAPEPTPTRPWQWAAAAAIVFAMILLVGVGTKWISWLDAAAYWLIFAGIGGITMTIARNRR